MYKKCRENNWNTQSPHWTVLHFHNLRALSTFLKKEIKQYYIQLKRPVSAIHFPTLRRGNYCLNVLFIILLHISILSLHYVLSTIYRLCLGVFSNSFILKNSKFTGKLCSILLSHLKIIRTHRDTLPSYLSMDLLSLRTFYYLTKVWLSFSSEFLTFIKMVPNFRYSLATYFIQWTLDFWNLSMLINTCRSG